MAWTDVTFPKVNELTTDDFLDNLRTEIGNRHSGRWILRLANLTNSISGTAGVGTLTTDFLNDGPIVITTTRSFLAVAHGVFLVTSPPSVLRLGFVRFSSQNYDTGLTYNEPSIASPYHNFAAETSRGAAQTLGWVQFFPNVPPGTHMFHCLWTLNGGGVGTLHSGFSSSFTVIEL
jgi:hypothetical protein